MPGRDSEGKPGIYFGPGSMVPGAGEPRTAQADGEEPSTGPDTTSNSGRVMLASNTPGATGGSGEGAPDYSRLPAQGR